MGAQTSRLSRIAVVVLALASVSPQFATAAEQTAKTVEFNIKAGDLATMLDRFAEQSGLQVVYDRPLTEALRGPGLSGRYSTREALNQLLKDSGIKWNYVNDKTVVLRQGINLSRVTESSVAGTLADGPGSSKDMKDPSQVVVQGERDKPVPFATANIDITRTPDDVLPFQVFTAQDIQQSGAANLAEFFRTRMPQNFTPFIAEENINNSLLASQENVSNFLNLANGSGGGGELGAGEIVILVNGRRLPNRFNGTQGEGDQTAGDFRGIPLASIERVEMLSSAGSAIYGAGATGGVINIITRRDYQGGSLVAGYENVMDGHAPKRSIEFDYGMPLKWGARLRVGYSTNDNDPLRLKDREYLIKRWQQTILEREPARIYSDLTPPQGATTNIRAFPPGTSLFGPGTASFTSVPDGYAGGPGTAAFPRGVFNLDLPEGASLAGFGRQSQLGAPTENTTYMAGVDWPLGNQWRLEFEYRRAESEMQGRGYNGPASRFAPRAIDPANPFGVTVQLTYYDPRFDRPELVNEYRTASDQFTASLYGARGEWRGVLDFNLVRDTDLLTNVNFMGPIGGNPLTSFRDAVRSGAYNVFVDMRTVAPAPPSFYEEYAQERIRGGGTTLNYQATAKISGPLCAVPAGTVQLTAGLEWLRQDRDKSFNDQSVVNSLTGALVLPASIRDRRFDGLVNTTDSLYAEAVAPLVSEQWSVPLVRKLDLFASGRIGRQQLDGFRVNGQTFVIEPDGSEREIIDADPVSYKTSPYLYAAGFRYDPIAGVALRASRSIGFRPPAFGEVVPELVSMREDIQVQDLTQDPFNQDRILAPDMYVSGGNTDLDPETTTSTNFGLILQPAFISGLRISMDYVENVRDDAITALYPQLVLDLEQDNPAIAALVQRDALGEITHIDARTVNFNQIVSKTADFTAQQQIENVAGGRLTLTAMATKTISFSIQTSPEVPAQEQVRNPEASSSYSFPIRWNGNFHANWQGQRWTLGWSTRYFDDILVPESWQLAQGSDRIKWTTTHDAFVNYRVPVTEGSVLSGASVIFGVKNIFDQEPRFSAAGGPYNLGIYPGDSAYQRIVWMQLRKDF